MSDFVTTQLSAIDARISEVVSVFDEPGIPRSGEEADVASLLAQLADEVAQLAKARVALVALTNQPSAEHRLLRQLKSIERGYERITGATLPDGTLPDADVLHRIEEEQGSKRKERLRSPTSAGLVFLCHSSRDKPSVRRLERRLKADGIQTWLDESNLLPGQDWDHEIRAAVRRAAAVVVCLSRGAVTQSGYLQKEIRFVLDVADEQPPGTIFVIPARLEECEVPERLRLWHWVDLFRRGGYNRLRAALNEVLSSKASLS